MLKTGKVRNYEAHHINNVASNPDFKGDPRNIRFLTPHQHRKTRLGHNGNTRIPTRGRLIDRQAMMDAYDKKMALKKAGK